MNRKVAVVAIVISHICVLVVGMFIGNMISTNENIDFDLPVSQIIETLVISEVEFDVEQGDITFTMQYEPTDLAKSIMSGSSEKIREVEISGSIYYYMTGCDSSSIKLLPEEDVLSLDMSASQTFDLHFSIDEDVDINEVANAYSQINVNLMLSDEEGNTHLQNASMINQDNVVCIDDGVS